METVEKIVELLNEKKKVYKALADDYKDRYNNNKDSNKAVCRNMYYQNIYRYNEAEDTLAEIEGRQPEIYCFTLPPFIDLPKIFAEYEKFRWHDLRKNPADVPKENVTVLLLTEVEPVTARYDNKYEAFFRLNDKLDYCVFIAPMSYIAWCEIPKFKEE